LNAGGPYRTSARPTTGWMESQTGREVEIAAGEFLSALGDQYNCKRLDGEPDEEYRERIADTIRGVPHRGTRAEVMKNEDRMEQAVNDAELAIVSWKKTAGRWRTRALRAQAELEKMKTTREAAADAVVRQRQNVIDKQAGRIEELEAAVRAERSIAKRADQAVSESKAEVSQLQTLLAHAKREVDMLSAALNRR
jgi:hypothetical protein